VPGDEPRNDADGMVKAVLDAGRARTGPRHAAPKKSLLTRLHVPTGKAIAIAAMPSAVLMGMGLTPQLASAKGLPKSPFRDGPCVSQPDKVPDDADKKQDKSEQDKASKDDAAKDSSGKDGQDSPSGTSTPKPSPSQSDSGKDDSGSAEDTKPEPSPSPSRQEEDHGGGGLLGGLGDVLGGLLGGGSSHDDDTASQTSADQPDSSSADTKQDDGPVKKTVDGVKDGVKDVTGAVGDTVGKAEDAAGKATKDAEDAAGEATGDKTADDPQAADDSGKPAFPCVEEKKVAGDNEQAPVTLPNQPWKLESSLLALHGLDYKGVVNLRTANGSTKQALKFTASSIDIGDLHQIVDGPNGLEYHVQAAKGSTSTIRHGTVTLYTEKLSGNMFGLLPITFDPEHPPPLNIPEVFFTHAKVTQAGQFGGTLTIPGLHQFITGS
jgi:hypothetical protein